MAVIGCHQNDLSTCLQPQASLQPYVYTGSLKQWSSATRACSTHSSCKWKCCAVHSRSTFSKHHSKCTLRQGPLLCIGICSSAHTLKHGCLPGTTCLPYGITIALPLLLKWAPLLQAAAIQWPDIFTRPEAEAAKPDLVEKMRAVRPVVETG